MENFPCLYLECRPEVEPQKSLCTLCVLFLFSYICAHTHDTCMVGRYISHYRQEAKLTQLCFSFKNIEEVSLCSEMHRFNWINWKMLTQLCSPFRIWNGFPYAQEMHRLHWINWGMLSQLCFFFPNMEEVSLCSRNA